MSWSIPIQERSKYDQIFDGLQPVNGLLTGDKVKPVLLNSKLPVDVLGRVWELSDIDGDGFLDREEFTVAMHLVYRALEKIPVPISLPPELVPLSKRRSAVLPILPGAVPVLPSLTTTLGTSSIIQSGGPSPPLVTNTSAAGMVGPKWVVTPLEKMQFDELFFKADTDMDGYVNGNEIKDIFLQSGLQQIVLAHIWNLCDTKSAGKLNSDQFALAMYLVQQTLKGIDPPAQLAPDMIPPSLRLGSETETVTSFIQTDTASMKELDILSNEIEDLKREKMILEQEKAQKEADVKIRNGEVATLQKELDALLSTVKQLELQRGEAQKRLDELDDKRTKLENSVAECKEKYKDDQKQIQELRYQITNRDSIVTNQEVELKRMKEELNVLRQEEVDLEQKLDASLLAEKKLQENMLEMQSLVSQTNSNIEKLRKTQLTLNQSANSYKALLNNEITEEQLTGLPPSDGSIAINGQFDHSQDSQLTQIGSTVAIAEQDPFLSHDPFSNVATVPSNSDPFQNEDPFAGSSMSDPFANPVGLDPFAENDPFKDAFGFEGNAKEFSHTLGGAGSSSSSLVASSGIQKVNTVEGSDPWCSTLSQQTSIMNSDRFDPFGTVSSMQMKPEVDFSDDPFGTGSFVPPGDHQTGIKSPTAPLLPPKQKRAPAPPRPPAPKPADGGKSNIFDGVDPFEDNASRSDESSVLSVKNDPFSEFENVNPPKFRSEAEQLAWAKRDSEQEFERQRRIREQEQADLELAIALSKQDFSGKK